jgi:hypothetical protein
MRGAIETMMLVVLTLQTAVLGAMLLRSVPSRRSGGEKASTKANRDVRDTEAAESEAGNIRL